MPLEGRILDSKFRFTKLLGAGGMGAVWRAHNIRVKKAVAIKLMHPEFAGNPGILDRFRNEATAAGEIGSQHICDIYDFGASVLGPYIVLEMLNGNSFGELIQKYGRVEPGLAAIVMRQALEGLEAAHKVGIIHRDLKPENIFLHEPTPGRLLVKLMDFGISKFSQGGNDGKTGVGVLMGTPEYMSPEQAEGAAGVDQRTDIWAMGAILYKALTGVEAFGGATMAATLVALATKEPKPIETYSPHVPPEMIAVVRKCLAKDPADRYQSARELADALGPFEQLGASLPQSAPITSSTGFSTTTPQASQTSGPMPSGTMTPPHAPATMITGQGPPGAQQRTFVPQQQLQPQPQTPTFSGNLAQPGTDDSWSLGVNAGEGTRPPSTLTTRPPSSGSKAPIVILVVLLLGAIGGAGFFMFAGKNGKGGKDGPTDTGTAVAGTAGTPDPKVDDPKTPPVDTKNPDPTGGTPPVVGTTAGTTAGDTKTPPDPTAGDTKTPPDATAGAADATAGDTKADDPDPPEPTKLPPPRPDLKLVAQAGSLFTPKVEAAATKTLVEAKAHCSSLRTKKFAKLEQWRLATSGEVLKFRDNPDIGKRAYWTSDKETGGKAKRVLMIRGQVLETDPNNSLNTLPFCVTKR